MTQLDLLQKQNEEFRQQAINSLIGGAAKDYAEYRELVGVIRGLSHANLNIQDLLRKLKSNDDD
jgi:translation initiation factor 1 (eIF-1/SUI1)